MDGRTIRTVRHLLRTEIGRIIDAVNSSEARSRVRIVLTGLVGFAIGTACGYAVWLTHASATSRNEPGGIGIPALVQQVREELIASDLGRRKSAYPALFAAKSVDLEVAFVAKKTGG